MYLPDGGGNCINWMATPLNTFIILAEDMAVRLAKAAIGGHIRGKSFDTIYHFQVNRLGSQAVN